MSIAAITTVFDRAPSAWPSGARLVALALADRVNDQGLAWPKLATLAAMTGLDTRSVSRHLSFLEADGWITRETRTGDTGRQTSNLYRWTAPTPGVTQVSPLTGTSSPTPPSGMTETTGRGDTGVGGSTTPVSGTGTTPVSPLEPSEEPSPQADTEPSLTNARNFPARAADDGDEIPTSCPKHQRQPRPRRGCAACERLDRRRAEATARAPTARTA